MLKTSLKKKLRKINDTLFDIAGTIEGIAVEIDEKSISNIDKEFEIAMSAVDLIHDARSYISDLT